MNDDDEIRCYDLIEDSSKNVQPGDDMTLIANPRIKDFNGIARCYWYTPHNDECEFLQDNSYGDACSR